MSIEKIPTFCIFGNPVQHSLSPTLHAKFAKQHGLTLRYDKIEPALNAFESALHQFIAAGGDGANVTAPFKERAFLCCDDVSERARIAKSVNTLVFKNNHIFGDNTDGVGLVRDIQKNLHYDLRGKKIIILGAGGAVRGILKPLLDENPADIFLFNRTTEKAKKLAKAFDINYLDTLENSVTDILIDALPADTNTTLPNTFSFSQNSLFYDLKYHSDIMPNNAARQSNGLGMLIEQAAEAFFVWFGKRST